MVFAAPWAFLPNAFLDAVTKNFCIHRDSISLFSVRRSVRSTWNLGRPGVHVGAFFRSWALLGCIFSVLLRFLSVLAGFCASYRVPDPVFGGFREGPGMVFKVPGPHFLRCFRDRELSMRLGS